MMETLGGITGDCVMCVAGAGGERRAISTESKVKTFRKWIYGDQGATGRAEFVCHFSHLADSQLAFLPGRQLRPQYLSPGSGKGFSASLFSPSQIPSVPILLQVVPPRL